MSSSVAVLSPSQWAVCTPEPGKVERDKTNGLLPLLTESRAFLVAIDSLKPKSHKSLLGVEVLKLVVLCHYSLPLWMVLYSE